MVQLMLVLGSIGCFLLGLLVLANNSKNIVNILSASINFCLSVWLIAILFFIDATSQSQAYITSKVYYVVAALFVALLTLFSFVFPKGDKIPKSVVYITTSLCLVVVAATVLLPNFVTGDMVIHPDGNYIEVDKITYIIYSIYFLLFFLAGIGGIVRKFIRSNRRIRSQLGIYLVGILAMAVPGLITDLLLPFYEDYSLVWVGPVMASVFVVVVSYGIVKRGMFDIKLAAVRTSAYLLSLITLSVIYYYVAYLVSVFLFDGSENASVGVGPVNIILALLLAFIFQPVKKFFNKVTNRIFYKDDYSTDDFFAKLNKTLTYTTDLRALLKRSATEIGGTLKSEQSFFVVNTTNGHFVTAGTNNHTQMPKADIADLNDYQEAKSGLVVASLLEQGNHIRRMMVSHKVELVLPLKQDGKILGYLCLGAHRNSGYTNRDIKVLTTISDELVIAIQNALSIQEVKNLNENLQQRINQATQELRESNAQLQRLDKAKDEFVSIASHQLRTPLTSVKGYISMVLEGDVGKITDTQRKLLVEAFSSSERMVHLINDFLNVSRLQTGKFLIEKTAVNLDEIIKQELKSLETTAKSRGLKFIYNSPKKAIPQLYVDDSKIRQVIMNYADNAIFYSPENTDINVSLSMKGDIVRFTVKDNGMGVPIAERSQLFTKFYRASNARRQRPDGTGVGLFLAKKVIDAHDGKIVFESVEGRGSTFGFELSASANKLPDSAK